MDPTATAGFAVTVNRPLRYMGKAELRMGPDSVTLVARPIRHYRVIVVSFWTVLTALVLIGGVLSWAGQLALKDPGLSGPALTSAHLMSEGVPVLVGVIAGLLVGGTYLLFSAFRGDPRSMSVPRTGVSLAGLKGKRLVLKAGFDAETRPRSWTLFARDQDEAKTIGSAVTTGA